MVRAVVTSRRDESLAQVAQRMGLREVACTPVLARAPGRRVVGMLTDRDLCRAAARGTSLGEIRADRAMSPVVRCCWADDSLEAAVAIMRGHGVRRLPVVDPAGRLVGLLSLSDVARSALARGLESDFQDDVVETYAAMSRPREGGTGVRP